MNILIQLFIQTQSDQTPCGHTSQYLYKQKNSPLNITDFLSNHLRQSYCTIKMSILTSFTHKQYQTIH